MRYAVGYLLITATALLFLNVYAVAIMRQLAFAAQERSMQAKVQLLSTSLSNLRELSIEGVAQVVGSVEGVEVSRIVITDDSAGTLFDSDTPELEEDAFFLTEDVSQALENFDVLYCKYDNGVLESRAAMPFYLGQTLTGAVYLLDFDAEQGAMIEALQVTILRISVVLAIAVLCSSLVFSALNARRMKNILQSVRTVREGDYSATLTLGGSDELSVLAEEFNKLTSRLQTSEQLRRRFVSDASHELKTPLASIKLLADSILQNEMDDTTVKEFVGDISGEADRLTRLSQKLLELTKMDSHADEDATVMDLAQIVGRATRMLTPLAERSKICIVTDIEKDCTVRAQGDDLYQIVFNLTENGIKYNVPNGKLSILAQKQEKQVILTVADEGVGIPDDAMEHIFERFYRVDKARSRAAGGAGLGLSIVHDMVLRNHGTIGVSHNQPTGTRFTVTLPLAETTEKES